MQVPVLWARAGAGAGARLLAGGVVHARAVPRAPAPVARARGRRRPGRAVRCLAAVAAGYHFTYRTTAHNDLHVRKTTSQKISNTFAAFA